ncbi:hypothetical protein EVAR_26586_1 [Eumeta japonica]|uniref:Uncharacterized protein n=1 Tax=Eumeta variegata TaxID=151549 RepID=A0A4C1W509_EUMVA|nr:hypothetical protein EVAR_26586_1 [Eumeta japonica]
MGRTSIRATSRCSLPPMDTFNPAGVTHSTEFYEEVGYLMEEIRISVYEAGFPLTNGRGPFKIPTHKAAGQKGPRRERGRERAPAPDAP